MKKTRFILALILALVMVVSAPLTVLAAEWDVSTSEEVEDVFATDTDAEVVLNMQNDIVMDKGAVLTAGEGQNYTINGNGNTISDVKIYGDGTVEINGDVTSAKSNRAALETYQDVTVTVNGDVAGKDANTEEEFASFGVIAEDNSTVVVNGDVTGGSGNMEDLSEPRGYSDGSAAVLATGTSNVTVNGDAKGGDSMGTWGYGASGIVAYDESTVTVNGDVTGGSVTADPEVLPQDEDHVSTGGDGVYAKPDATVVVNGNVTAGSTNGNDGVGGAGIFLDRDEDLADGPAADATGSVTVNGTVTGGTGGENGTSGAAIVYEVENKNADQEIRLIKVPAAELTEEEQEELVGLIVDLANSGYLTDDELMAYIEDYFGGEIPEDATLADVAAIAQTIITDMMPELNEENPLYEEEYASVTAWELSDASGLLANSQYGALLAELYSADTTEYIIRVTQPKGGTITVDKETALEGETITITVAVEDGCTLKSVSCGAGEPTDNGDGTYSFVVPAGGGVEVSAVIDAPPAATPATGDSFNMALTTALAVVSLLGICALTFTRKKTV